MPLRPDLRLTPAQRIAFTIARTQIPEQRPVTPNIAAVLIIKLAELIGEPITQGANMTPNINHQRANDDLMQVFAIEERLTDIEDNIIKLLDLIKSLIDSAQRQNESLGMITDAVDLTAKRIDMMRADVDLVYKKGTW